MANTYGISFLHRFDLGNRNLVELGANILSVTSTAAGDFDKGNLTTESLRHVWRSASVLSWQEIVIEAEVESAIDTFAILGHNFTSTAVVQLQANIANNFLAPPVTLSLPVTPNNIVLCQDLGVEYSHYKIRILDPGNPCGYVQIGRIVGGRAFTFTNNEDITDDYDIDNEDMSDTMRNEGFFRVSNERIKRRTLSVRFRKLKTSPTQDANYLGLKDLTEHVGTTRPFLTILDRDDPGFCSIWGQQLKLTPFSFTINRFVDASLRIEEVF